MRGDQKDENGGRDGEGKTVAEGGLVETLMVEGSIVTSGSFGSQVRDLFLECCSLQILRLIAAYWHRVDIGNHIANQGAKSNGFLINYCYHNNHITFVYVILAL